MRLNALIVSVLVASPALAQEKQWTAAPVPSISDGRVMPAARAGEPVANDHSTPFSSVPSGSVAADGATSADQVNGVKTPDLAK